MTCILGYTNGKEVTIAADSLGSNGHEKTNRADDKLFKVGEFIIGATSSYRMIQLLRYGIKHEDNVYCLSTLTYKNKDTERFMVTEFIEMCRKILKHGGYAGINNNKESAGTFLVGLKGGHLFKVEGDFQVAQNNSSFNSCGCGGLAAISAATAIKAIKKKINPKVDLPLAINITSDIVEGVGGTVKLLTI